MHVLAKLLERHGKLEGRDYQVVKDRIVGLKVYSGDWTDIETAIRAMPDKEGWVWTHRLLSTVPDPEGDEQMDVLSIEIRPKWDL